jgi:hypothetical protein
MMPTYLQRQCGEEMHREGDVGGVRQLCGQR